MTGTFGLLLIQIIDNLLAEFIKNIESLPCQFVNVTLGSRDEIYLVKGIGD